MIYDDQARASTDPAPPLPHESTAVDEADLTGDIKDVYDQDTQEYSDQLYASEDVDEMINGIDDMFDNVDGMIDNAFQSYFTADTFHVTPSADHIPWSKEDASVVLPGPWHESSCFYMDVHTGECLRVDAETDTLSAAELIQFETEVMAADAAEVKSFLDHKVFGTTLPTAHCQLRAMSCTWVRKWKWTVIDGKRVRIVKSRLCVRGFMDPQKHKLTKHSSTASRLTQRLHVSICVQNDFAIESWDISVAFLQGFSFKLLEKILKLMNLPAPLMTLKAYITVPRNVWKHCVTHV